MNEDVRDELQLLRELGFTHLDLSRRSSDAAPAASDGDSIPIAMAEEPLEEILAGIHSLAEIAPIAAVCTRCRLANGRKQVVWGTGNPHAELLFIGEAPGRDEDLAGEPFVGRAGQLLTDIIKAMGFSREEVYIANVIKCRPPENRNPEPDELEACRPWLRRQIELIAPKVIVTLGRFALQSTLERTVAISGARGEWLDYRGIRLMPTYHPAYLLRNPSAKRDVWSDMKKVMTVLGKEPAK
jgi:uracil-DNA glycosylase family 4